MGYLVPKIVVFWAAERPAQLIEKTSNAGENFVSEKFRLDGAGTTENFKISFSF